jgi:SAM-dependent methyltransferase
MSNPLDAIIDRSLNYGRHHIDSFLGFAHQSGWSSVLDIGAGLGSDLLLARRHNPSAALHAIEIYPDYQTQLRDKGIHVAALNIERDVFPFLDGSMDVVIANQVLEHVKDLFWLLHETSRVLRVGGHLIIGVPNLGSFHNRLLLLFGKQPTCIQNHSAHVRGYTKGDLLTLFDVCFPKGYALQRFAGSNFYPFPPFIAKPLAAVLPTMAWGIFFLLRKQRSYSTEFLQHPVVNRLETHFYLGDGTSTIINK